jgi:drug/metabolite transporter (DMT)-like permease
MLLIGRLFFNEQLSLSTIVGAVFSVTAVCIVLTRGHISNLLAIQLVSGDLWMLAATMCWATYSWLLACPSRLLRQQLRPRWSWADFLFLQALFGALWAIGGAAFEATFAHSEIKSFTWLQMLGVVFIAVGPSLIAYRCWGLGVASAGPTIAAFFFNLTPLFTALLQALLLGVWPSPYHLLALIFFLIGIAFSTKGKKRIR